MAKRTSRKNKTILCIPGLGGHRSAFGGYNKMIPEFSFKYVEVINWQEALAEIKEIAREQELILLCSCYGVQLGLRLIEEMSEAVTRLIVIEPFFAEFHWWRRPAIIINKLILSFLKLTDRLGIRRQKFTYEVDYMKLTKYPIYFQPIFDMRWQNLTDYFDKIQDMLIFKLPENVQTKSLFIFSPTGFIRSQRIKNKLRKIFINSEAVETNGRSHNVITSSKEETTGIIREWLINNNL